LQEHPAVREAMAFGYPDPKVQELVTAVVVLNPGYDVSKDLEQELTAFVNGKLTDFKHIRGGVIFRDSMPRNSMGKLVRKEMRDWARSLQAAKVGD